MLPEYLFENVAEYIEFLSRYNAEALDDADKDILITFTIVFLSPGYVNNPFMKAKLVSVSRNRTCKSKRADRQGLSNGVIPQGYWRKGPLYERLGVHPLSTQYLMPTLIRFFIGELHRVEV
jgi:ubiquitin conjugation factor E4 B